MVRREFPRRCFQVSPYLVDKLLLLVEAICLRRDDCWRFGDTLPKPAAEVSSGGNGALFGSHRDVWIDHEMQKSC